MGETRGLGGGSTERGVGAPAATVVGSRMTRDSEIVGLRLGKKMKYEKVK